MVYECPLELTIKYSLWQEITPITSVVFLCHFLMINASCELDHVVLESISLSILIS